MWTLLPVFRRVSLCWSLCISALGERLQHIRLLGTAASYTLIFSGSFTSLGDMMQSSFVGDFYGACVCVWVSVYVCLCVSCPPPSCVCLVPLPRLHCAFFLGLGCRVHSDTVTSLSVWFPPADRQGHFQTQHLLIQLASCTPQRQPPLPGQGKER